MKQNNAISILENPVLHISAKTAQTTPTSVSYNFPIEPRSGPYRNLIKIAQIIEGLFEGLRSIACAVETQCSGFAVMDCVRFAIPVFLGWLDAGVGIEMLVGPSEGCLGCWEGSNRHDPIANTSFCAGCRECRFARRFS